MKRRELRKGVTRMGDARSPHGVLYALRGNRKEDRVHLWASILLDHLRAKGIPVTIKAQLAARSRARAMVSKLDAEITRKGIPQNLRQLLEACSKREQARIAGQINVTAEDFESLVYNCRLLGLTHRTKNVELIPDHLDATVEEADAFFHTPKVPGQQLQAAARRYWKKLTTAFDERKCTTVHMFIAKNGPWHCFYFTHRDIFPDRRDGSNHWQAGPHFHYVSHFWPEWTSANLWTALDQRRTPAGTLHLRYLDRADQ